MASPNSGRLEHVGIAVEDASAVKRLYEKLLGLTSYKQEGVKTEGVRTHFIQAGTAKLELLEALGEDSPIARHLERRGEGLHHLAFDVDDIHAQMRRVRAEGFTPLSEEARQGADGKLVFFLHPRDTHGVLVEFCQSERGRWSPHVAPSAGGQIAYYEAGDTAAPPVVLLHGAAGSTVLELESLARALEPHFHVIALDFVGHGASSSMPEGDFSFDLFSDNVLSVMDEAGLDDANLFGFSMGGAVALYLALTHPGHFRKIAVHNTNLFWDEDTVGRMLARLDVARLERSPVSEELDSIHSDWKALFGKTASFIEALPQAGVDVGQFDTTKNPVLISAVDQDELFSVKASLALHDLLPDSRLAILPGSDHRLGQRQIDVLLPVLRFFFLAET